MVLKVRVGRVYGELGMVGLFVRRADPQAIMYVPKSDLRNMLGREPRTGDEFEAHFTLRRGTLRPRGGG